jgi:hypothetical protein
VLQAPKNFFFFREEKIWGRIWVEGKIGRKKKLKTRFYGKKIKTEGRGRV